MQTTKNDQLWYMNAVYAFSSHVMDFQVNLDPIRNVSYLSLIRGIMFEKAEESFFFPFFFRTKFSRGPL